MKETEEKNPSQLNILVNSLGGLLSFFVFPQVLQVGSALP